MKLHHFITAQPTEEGKRIRELGKALAPEPTQPQVPVTEVKLTDLKKVEPKKVATVAKAGDVEQEMRDYAVDQLATTHHLAHHKIKHYD